MKLGLLADVRGLLGPLETALGLLAREGCERVACLGSTAEGGPEDEAVLGLLRDAEAVLVPSPHDQGEAVTGLPAEAELAGLLLTHATPEALPPAESLWATGSGVPVLAQVAAQLAGEPAQQACGEWFEALAYVVPDEGEARRRLFLRSGRLEVPRGSMVLCPGSVAMAPSWRRGGAVVTWDDEQRELAAIRFNTEGAIEDDTVRVIVYCEEFEAHRPDDSVLRRVALEVRDDADEIAADVERVAPDFVLLDYHLAGELSGLDALLALRPGGAALPVPIFTIAGNPADQGGMKDLGALGSLPFAYLKDTFTRLLTELGGAG